MRYLMAHKAFGKINKVAKTHIYNNRRTGLDDIYYRVNLRIATIIFSSGIEKHHAVLSAPGEGSCKKGSTSHGGSYSWDDFYVKLMAAAKAYLFCSPAVDHRIA